MNYTNWKNINNEDLEGEIWKPVPGFNQTEASNFGRIKTIDRYVKVGTRDMFVKVKVKTQVLGKDGYLRVNAALNGRSKKVTAHRLCALAFHPNPLKKKTVQHFNDIKHCNEDWNLGWFTQKEQVRDAMNKGRLVFKIHSGYKKGKDHYAYGRRGGEVINSVPVMQCDINGNEIKRWGSISDVARDLKIKNVSACIRGIVKTSGGYLWKRLS